jgi:Ca2+:H+ antiporter
MLNVIRSELAFLGAAASAIAIYAAGERWLPGLTHPLVFATLFIWVFGIMVWACFGAVRHADSLAELLGEPYGTLILTFAATCIEISVMVAIMVKGELYPGLPRDTMMAVVMIVLNGMVGACLLIGGIRFREQEFNLQGARAFLAVLVTLAILALILPRFMGRADAFEIKLARAIPFSVLTVVLYGAFIAIQTIRHRHYFTEPGRDGLRQVPEHGKHPHGITTQSLPYHGILLVLTLVPIVLLAEKLAILVDEGANALSVPIAAGGILIAILVLAPEGLAAVRAARINHLQRALNICLGSALATIGLTVPAVVTLSLVTGIPVVLGLDDSGMVLLMLTLLVSVITFSGQRTNVLQGVVHLVIFAVYVTMVLVP